MSSALKHFQFLKFNNRGICFPKNPLAKSESETFWTQYNSQLWSERRTAHVCMTNSWYKDLYQQLALGLLQSQKKSQRALAKSSSFPMDPPLLRIWVNSLNSGFSVSPAKSPTVWIYSLNTDKKQGCQGARKPPPPLGRHTSTWLKVAGAGQSLVLDTEVPSHP